VCSQTPKEAGARDYSEGLVLQYFDVSFYIVKLVLYNLTHFGPLFAGKKKIYFL